MGALSDDDRGPDREDRATRSARTSRAVRSRIVQTTDSARRRPGRRRSPTPGRRSSDELPKSTITAKGIAGIVVLINTAILIGEAIIDQGC